MELFACTAPPKHLSLHITLSTLIFSLLFSPDLCLAARTGPRLSSNTEFIKNSCGVTLYPDICYKTLSSYASTIQTSPTELACTALNVTLNSARSVSSAVSDLSRRNDLGQREAGAIVDCVETIGDSVDELRKSLAEMKDLSGPEFGVKMGNIQTWVSAALTDEDTCMDGFEGSGLNGKIKGTIRSHIVKVAQLTSNALALINRL